MVVRYNSIVSGAEVFVTEEEAGEMKEYEIVKKETICEGRFLRCLKITYQDGEGTERQWEAAERVECEGVVAVVPVTDEGEMILARQFRPPVGNYVVEFPAGLQEEGESSEEAASRELLEETGYEAKEMIFLAKGPLSSGLSTEVLSAYLARGLTFKGLGKRDETEDLEVIRVPAERIYQALSLFSEQGDLIDLKIYGFIEMARKHLSI